MEIELQSGFPCVLFISLFKKRKEERENTTAFWCSMMLWYFYYDDYYYYTTVCLVLIKKSYDTYLNIVVGADIYKTIAASPMKHRNGKM